MDNRGRDDKVKVFFKELIDQVEIIDDAFNKHMEKCNADEKRVKSQYDEACFDISEDVKAFEKRIDRWRLMLKERYRGPDKALMADEHEDEVFTFLTNQQREYNANLDNLPKWTNRTEAMKAALGEIEGEEKAKIAMATVYNPEGGQQLGARLKDKKERLLGVKNLLRQATASSSNTEPLQDTDPRTPINNPNTEPTTPINNRNTSTNSQPHQPPSRRPNTPSVSRSRQNR